MKKLNTEKDKQVLSKVISRDLLKKYNLSHLAIRLGVSGKRLRSNSKRDAKMIYDRKPQSNIIGVRVGKSIKDFLEEDINSRTLPGKKDYIVRKGLRRQKKILCDSMKNLHQKYLKEHSGIQISYATFCRLKPFWIVRPKCSDRDTCGCKLHINASYMIDRLVQHGVLPASSCSFTGACQHVVCDTNSKSCMYGECTECKEKKISLSNVDRGKQTWVYSWQNKTKEREVQKPDGQSKIRVRITVKEKIQYTLYQLAEELTDFLKAKFTRHIFNIRHQYQKTKALKETLSDDSCIIHIDFSENYSCKYATEPQSVHFGASRNQVSLHTGVLYRHMQPPLSFCSMSENTRHDPSAIWAHLHPILEDLKSSNPNIKTVHFMSDGPTTQYRSRKHFFLMKEKMHKMYGFTTVTWNFSESGHGKGAPDGIGGVVKSEADRLVAQGADVVNVHDLYTCLDALNLKIRLHKIPSDHIRQIDAELPSPIALVPGTLSVHQVISNETEDFILTRVLSCFCSKDRVCQCFAPKKTVLYEGQGITASHEEVANLEVVDTPSGVNGPSNMLCPLTLECLDENLVGKWVVVLYDALPYPGVIQDVDADEIEVKVLHRVGENRFFWPMMADVIWYKVPTMVVGLIPELQPVTKRHMQISPEVWLKIKSVLSLDQKVKAFYSQLRQWPQNISSKPFDTIPNGISLV